MTITPKQYEQIQENIIAHLLEPNQLGGPWFYGSEAVFEKWAGDVFSEVVILVLKEVGITIDQDAEG